ncbi:MAG: dihydropteroate synthase, partial [Fimbriimonadales bacterium]
VAVSIDTMKPGVARAAIDAGATVLNDVNGLRALGMLEAAAEAGVYVCIMHMLGEPRTMQTDPQYDDVVEDVLAWLTVRAEEAQAAGVQQERIWLDPGIGFGKTVDHNLSLLKATATFASSGYPILVGASRKSFIGKIADEADPINRLPGSLAAALFAAQKGARILRVHDVAATVQALAVQTAILDAE